MISEIQNMALLNFKTLTEQDYWDYEEAEADTSVLETPKESKTLKLEGWKP